MTKPRPAELPNLSREAVLEQLGKVLLSAIFQGSERSAKLLRFLVLRTLDGEAASLKEYTLGAEALGKGTSFDPRTDTIVRTEVSRLRGRLEKYYAAEGKSDPVTITLVRGSYVPQFQTPVPQDSPADASRGTMPRRSRGALAALAVGVAVVMVLAVALLSPWRTPAAEGAVSVAVIPFANLSSDAEQEFFSDGVTDEIGTALVRIAGLRVIARQSAYRFKGSKEDARAIGQALGATHLITGSVRKAGEHVRINAELVRADDGLRLWAQNYDRNLTDMFHIQEDIAQAIAVSLSRPLGIAPGENPLSNRTKDGESYEASLRAKALIRSRRVNQINDAIALLEKTVARNPDYAPAWALLGDAYRYVPRFDPMRLIGATEDAHITAEESLAKAEMAAKRAIMLDPDDAEGYLALASIAGARWNHALAVELQKKALALDPEHPDGLNGYGIRLAELGYLKRAVATKEHLQAIEPYVPAFRSTFSMILWASGQTQAAISINRGPPEGSDVMAALFYASDGRFKEAADTLQYASLEDPVYEPLRDAAVRLLRAKQDGAPVPKDLPFFGRAGWLYLYTDTPERVLEYHEGNLKLGVHGSIEVVELWGPAFAPIRKTERFKKFVSDAGFVDFWRASGWPDLCRPVGTEDFACD